MRFVKGVTLTLSGTHFYVLGRPSPTWTFERGQRLADPVGVSDGKELDHTRRRDKTLGWHNWVSLARQQVETIPSTFSR